MRPLFVGEISIKNQLAIMYELVYAQHRGIEQTNESVRVQRTPFGEFLRIPLEISNVFDSISYCTVYFAFYSFLGS